MDGLTCETCVSGLSHFSILSGFIRVALCISDSIVNTPVTCIWDILLGVWILSNLGLLRTMLLESFADKAFL